MKEEHVATRKVTRDSWLEVLRRNLDLVVLGLALVALGLHVGGFLLSPPAEAEETESVLQAAKKEVEGAVSEARFSLEAERAGLKDLEARVVSSFKATFEKPPPMSQAPTYPAVLVRAARAGETNVLRFLPPADLRVEAQKGVNVLRWVEHEENNVQVGGFVILRGDGTPETANLGEIAQVPSTDNTYRDESAKPGLTYTYRVQARAASGPQTESATSDLSKPVSVETLADFKLTLEDVDQAANTGRFLVEKWHQDTWWPKKFQCAVGQVIGERDEGTGVDYTTPRKLQSLDIKPTKVERVVREVVFNDEAQVILENGIPLTEELTVPEEFLAVTAVVEGGELPPKVYTLEKR